MCLHYCYILQLESSYWKIFSLAFCFYVVMQPCWWKDNQELSLRRFRKIAHLLQLIAFSDRSGQLIQQDECHLVQTLILFARFLTNYQLKQTTFELNLNHRRIETCKFEFWTMILAFSSESSLPAANDTTQKFFYELSM